MSSEFEEVEGAGTPTTCQVAERAPDPVSWLKTQRAYALAWVRGDERWDADSVCRDLADSVSGFTDPGGDVALATLAEHLPILEALWLRLMTEAVKEKITDRQARKVRSAMLAHQEYCRTLVLVQGLARQKRDLALVTVGDGVDGGANTDD